MAKIYISYQREDQVFATELAGRLKATGHSLTYDVDALSAGTDWRATLDQGLHSSEIFVVIVSKSTLHSQTVLSEVGTARAYSRESGRMLMVPIILDDAPIPLAVQDIHCIIQPDRNLDDILPKIEIAIAQFIGHRAATQAAQAEAAEKIQSNAADYIKVAIDSLAKLESRDRWLGYIWYGFGFASLLLGIGFTLLNLSMASQMPTINVEALVFLVLKALVVVGLLGACAKYAFTLGKSYASEALKCSDRIHAIRFGEFYLRAFGEKIKWDQLKEVFQHWNIDRTSSFSSMDASSFDPKIMESMVEVSKLFKVSKSDK